MRRLKLGIQFLLFVATYMKKNVLIFALKHRTMLRSQLKHDVSLCFPIPLFCSFATGYSCSCHYPFRFCKCCHFFLALFVTYLLQVHSLLRVTYFHFLLFSFSFVLFFLIRILFSFVIFDVFIHYLIMDSEFSNGVFSFLSILVSRRLFACLFSKLLYLCC